MTGSNTDTTLATVGIGSNLGDSVRQVQQAVAMVDALPGTRVTAQSRLYRSAPMGPADQPHFINAVCMIETSMNAAHLLNELKRMERKQGREAGGRRWGPRVIDLDLLTFGEEVHSDPALQVPHPGIASRNFVLLPLKDVAPELVIAGLGPLSELVVNRDDPEITCIDATEIDDCQSLT